MTRFDADIPSLDRTDASPVSVRAVVGSHPGIMLLSICLAGIAIAVASMLLLIGQGASVRVARTVDALQLSVFLQPQVNRADAEGLRSRIEAIPNVGSARLRTREDAMTALAGGGMSSLATKVNPLPDVWIVSLAASSTEGHPSLSSRVAQTRLALEALPSVESVRVDGRWVDLLDRWSSWTERGMTLATWIVSATLLLSLLALSLISGRALSAGLPREDRLQALATVGMIAGLLALVLAIGSLALLTTSMPDLGAIAQPILDSVGRSGHVFVVAMGVAIVFVAALGHAMGGSRR